MKTPFNTLPRAYRRRLELQLRLRVRALLRRVRQRGRYLDAARAVEGRSQSGNSTEQQGERVSLYIVYIRAIFTI